MTDENELNPKQGNLHPFNRQDGPYSKLAHELGSYDKAQEALGLQRKCPGEIHDTPAGAEMRKLMDGVLSTNAAKSVFRDARDWCEIRYTKDIEGKPWHRHFEPRHIVPPGGFASPKHAASMLVSQLLEVTIKDRLGLALAPVEITSQLISYNVFKYKVPMFYVSEALLRSVAAMKIPGDYTVGDVKWPMPAMALGLPLKFMNEFVGREVPYVMIADINEGDCAAPPWVKDMTFDFCGMTVPVGHRPTIGAPSKFAFWYNTWNAEHSMPEAFVTSWYKKDRIADIADLYGYTDYTNAVDSKIDDDKVVADKIGSLLLKLMAVLNLRPALMKQASIIRPAKVNRKTGHVEKSELWSPNMLGENYQIPRINAPSGTHASPHWHFRSGHVVLQRIGSLTSPDFVSVKSLPRYEDTGEIDWTKVDDDTKARFWRSHKRLLLESTLVNWDEETMGPPPPNSED